MYEKSNINLFIFLQGDWPTRMRQVCGEEVVTDEDNEAEFVDAQEEGTLWVKKSSLSAIPAKDLLLQ